MESSARSAAVADGARRRGHWTATPVVLVRGSMCENAVKPEKGSGGPEMRRRRAIARNELTCGGVPSGELTALVVALVARAVDEM